HQKQSTAPNLTEEEGRPLRYGCHYHAQALNGIEGAHELPSSGRPLARWTGGNGLKGTMVGHAGCHDNRLAAQSAFFSCFLHVAKTARKVKNPWKTGVFRIV